MEIYVNKTCIDRIKNHVKDHITKNIIEIKEQD